MNLCLYDIRFLALLVEHAIQLRFTKTTQDINSVYKRNDGQTVRDNLILSTSMNFIVRECCNLRLNQRAKIEEKFQMTKQWKQSYEREREIIDRIRVEENLISRQKCRNLPRNRPICRNAAIISRKTRRD